MDKIHTEQIGRLARGCQKLERTCCDLRMKHNHIQASNLTKLTEVGQCSVLVLP